MAQTKQQKRDIFFQKHPNCYICGDIATQIDHMPPRILFLRKQAPVDYEFPVCHRCNHNTSKDEQAAAFLFYQELNNMENDPDERKRLKKITNGIKNNNKELLSELTTHSSAVFQKKTFRETFGIHGDILRHRGYYMASLGKECQHVMFTFSYKMLHAIYYKITGFRFSGYIFCRIADLKNKKEFHSIKDITESMQYKEDIIHRFKSQGNFFYKYNISLENDAFSVSIFFGGQFIILLYGFLEKFIKEDKRAPHLIEKMKNGRIFKHITFDECINKNWK